MQEEFNGGTDPFPEMNQNAAQTKFCQYCGNKINPQAKFCPHCGALLEANQPQPQAAPPAQNAPYGQYPQYPPQYPPVAQPTPTSNTLAIVGFVLSFLIPLAGLICSIIGLQKVKVCKSGQGLAIAGIIISAVSMVISLIISFVYIDLIFNYIFYWY